MSIKSTLFCLRFALFFVAACADLPAGAQVFPGSLILTRQGLVDSVPILLGPVEVVLGNMLIGTTAPGATTDIHDLTPLQSLRQVRGSVSIRQNPLLATLHGLENIDSIGEDGYISRVYDNDSLQDLSGLSGLRFFGDVFVVEGNDRLQSLNGLQNIKDAGGGDISLSSNYRLANLGGLENLEEAGWISIHDNALVNISLPKLKSAEKITVFDEATLMGFGSMQDSLTLRELWLSTCPLLTDLTSLQNVQVTYRLYISSDSLLSNLSPLSNCCDSMYTFEISANPNLGDTVCFRTLHHVSSQFSFYQNGGVELASFPSLETVGPGFAQLDTFYVGYNDALRHFSAPKLRETSTSILFRGNPQLQNLDSLNQLERVGGSLRLWENESLSSITGLSNLKRVDAELGIYKSGLSNLHGLEGLQSVHTLEAQDNPNLTSLCAFQLKKINFLAIAYNKRLKSIQEVSAIKRLDEGFRIHDCDSLINIASLNSLDTLGNMDKSFFVNFFRNKMLDSINLLQNTVVIGDRCQSDIGYNENLRAIKLHNVVTVDRLLYVENPRLKHLSLPDLQAVIKVVIYQGKVIIRGNDSLSTLDGIKTIKFVSDSLVIRQNPALYDCAALCAILEHVPASKIKLGPNAFPCNTVLEVKNYICDTITSVQSPNGQTVGRLVAFPSPAYDYLRLEGFEGAGIQEIAVQVFDLSGRLVLRQVVAPADAPIDISRLVPGVYVAHMPMLGIQARFVVWR